MMRRTPLNRVSNARQKVMAERREMMAQHFGPRPWSCAFWLYAHSSPVKDMIALPACFGEVNGHELKKRSAGGSITDPENVVPLCDVHNDWIEDHPRTARTMGLVK